MKHWTYTSLVEALTEQYQDCANEGLTPEQAAERCFYEFDFVERDGDIEKWVVNITIGSLLLGAASLNERHRVRILEATKGFDRDVCIKGFSNIETDSLCVHYEDIKRSQQNVR